MDVHAILDAIPAPAVYELTGLIILLESVGIPLPGEIMLVTAALFASGPHPHVSIHLVALAAILGAVIAGLTYAAITGVNRADIDIDGIDSGATRRA